MIVKSTFSIAFSVGVFVAENCDNLSPFSATIVAATIVASVDESL